MTLLRLLLLLLLVSICSSLETCRLVATKNVTLPSKTPYSIDLATNGIQVALDPNAFETPSNSTVLMLELFASDACGLNMSDSEFIVLSKDTDPSLSVELRSPVVSAHNNSHDMCERPAPNGNIVWAMCHSGTGCGDRFSSASQLTTSVVVTIAASTITTLGLGQTMLLAAFAGTAMAQTNWTMSEAVTAESAFSSQSNETATETPSSQICFAYVRARLFIHGRFNCQHGSLVATVTAGAKELGIVNTEPIACPGRPYLVGGDDAPMMSRASHATDDERAARWVARGLGEHASVASFAAFSLQLMVNGAPFALLTGAANANADEVRHAEQSFALASRFAGRVITAEPFPRRAISALGPQSLEELAEAALREGCIAETLSVFAAAREIEETAVIDAEERAVLVGIVRDEARHSALAWRTVAWASGAARNATLNQRLAQIVADEHARCAQAVRCALFEQLIVPLADRLIGANDWQRVVSSDDVTIAEQSSRSLTEITIDALKRSFEYD
jgi:hypothetical protein